MLRIATVAKTGGPLKVLRIIAICLLALILQLTVFVELRIFGVVPELLALVAIMAGLIAGSQQGSIIAFGAGLLWDVYLSTPLGLSAAAFALVAYVVGGIEAGLFYDSRIQMVVLVLLASAATVALYVLLGELLGQSGLVNPELVKVITLISVMNAGLSIVAAPLMRWAFT